MYTDAKRNKINMDQPLTNTHLLGGCKHNSKLRTSRHNSTFKLLHEQLEKHNGGRWPIISMDLGNKSVKDFRIQTKIEMTTPQSDSSLQALEATNEGLQNDKKKSQHPTIIPTNRLPKHKRPKHHKPDIIRAIGYQWNAKSQIVEDPTYKGRRCLQLIECKYSTDSNLLDTITNIHNIYEPLKHAIIRHKTVAEIAQLVLFHENPPDNLTYRSLPPQAQSITMEIHVHAQEWLTLISKVSRSTLTHRQKPPKHTTTNN
jgi:hypothetical protein